jgi:signal transduction histidine kinase
VAPGDRIDNVKGPRRLAPTTWLTAAALVLLPVLAALQYHWLTQIGADAGGRMRDVVVSAMDAVSRDLAFEIERSRRDRTAGDTGTDAGASGSSLPLVVDALVIDRDDRTSRDPRLRRWDLEARTCEPVPWPDGFDDVRADVSGRLASPFGRDAHELTEALGDKGPSHGFVVLEFLRPRDARRQMVPPPCAGLDEGVILFRLDMTLLRQTLLPELVRRHLDDLQRHGILFAVVDQPSLGVIYVSPGADAASIGAKPDVSIPLAFRGRGGETRGPRGAPGQLRGGPPQTAERGGRPRGATRAGWVLVAQHRAGSLESAVRWLRAGNLAVSFGILLVLGLAVAMISLNARRAERLAKQQVEFVAGVSHEMRTPVSAIDLAAKNLEDGLIADPVRVQRYGHVIRTEARRLGDTVERVLQFAALDAGRGLGPLVRVDLGAVVEEVISRARAQHPEASIELEVEGARYAVRGDPAILGSCVQNLIGNALKYGGTPARVGIRLTGQATSSPEASLVVEDHGPGIDSTDLPHVFEPFYRGRLATEQRISGSGLGLYIVKRCVEAMGGRVSVKTGKGSGTAVTLHLPLLGEAETTDGESTTRTPGRG